jgi:Tol biopolymer transport system component
MARSPAQVQPDREHRAARIDEGSAETEVGADARVRRQTLAPAGSTDGRWLAVAANRDGEPRLFKIPVDGGTPVPLVQEYSIDPTWSPSGQFLVYSGATSLSRGFSIDDFDVSPDGREIIFDRTREQSDIVLFELPRR